MRHVRTCDFTVNDGKKEGEKIGSGLNFFVFLEKGEGTWAILF